MLIAQSQWREDYVMSRGQTPVPVLTLQMARELAHEIEGLQSSAEEPEQYDAKLAALRAIANGWCVVRRTKLGAAISRVKIGYGQS